MAITPETILIWAQLGKEIFLIGKGGYDSVQAAANARGIEADNAGLQKVKAAYESRIAQREKEIAEGQPRLPNGGLPGDTGE